MSAPTSTIDLLDCGQAPWDVAVVGAGPAGATAALVAAREGRRVLLIDKSTFPRWKVCGCCLNRRGIEALERNGAERITAAGVPLTTMHLGAGGRSADIPLPNYIVLSRERLDSDLVSLAIDHGAEFISGASADSHAVNEDSRSISLTRGELQTIIEARVLIVANGLGSKLLRNTDDVSDDVRADARIGAGATFDRGMAEYEPGTIYMACDHGGYVGLQQLEDGRLDVAAAFDATFVRDSGGLGSAAAHVMNAAGFDPVPEIREANWRGTKPLTRAIAKPSGRRALVVGDAAGYVEPFTGEGMTWAITTGLSAGELAANSIENFSEATEREWQRRHRKLVSSRQWACQILSAVLRRPSLSMPALRMIELAPGLASPLIGAMNAPVR